MPYRKSRPKTVFHWILWNTHSLLVVTIHPRSSRYLPVRGSRAASAGLVQSIVTDVSHGFRNNVRVKELGGYNILALKANPPGYTPPVYCPRAVEMAWGLLCRSVRIARLTMMSLDYY